MEKSFKLFVTVGTQKFPFNRLINAIEKIVLDGLFSKEEVLIQSGLIIEEKKSVNIIKSIPGDEFDSILRNAEIVITHAGNSIISCMRLQKDFIIVPRLKQYGEHIDDHQLELAKVMKTQFNVPVLENMEQLPELIGKVKKHQYKPWDFGNKTLLKSISDYLLE